MHLDVLGLTPAQLDAITQPEALFTKGQKAVVVDEFRALALRWHPDRNPGGDTLFAHISGLKDEALAKLEKGIWETPGLYCTSLAKSHVALEIHYHKRCPFDLGEMFICTESVVYVFNEGNDDFYQNAVTSLSSFTYSSDRMREECERYVPKIKRQLLLADGRKALVLSKTAELIRLRDLLDYQGGKIDPLHVAWIQSSLHNLACYLEYTGLTHMDISPDSYFISPEHHSGVLIGGWWFSRKVGGKLLGASLRTVNLLPPPILKDKVALPKIDLELVKATGREILGDTTGVRLRKVIGLPAPMVEFVKATSTGMARTDYASWRDTLLKCYGKRKFVKLEVHTSQVYPKP